MASHFLQRRAQVPDAVLVLLLLLLPFSLLAGCSSFHETHYFKSVNAKGEPVNYYKLTVTGGSTLSSSRYLSGYFDESAVETYFGEYVQPDKGHFPATKPAAEGETQVRSLDQSWDGRRLVLLLTSNSDAVAEGIQSLAQSEGVAATLARVVGRDRLAASRDASGELAVSQARAKAASTLIGTLITPLSTDAASPAPQPDAEAAMLRAANALVTYLDRDRAFKSLDEVAAWVRENGNKALED